MLFGWSTTASANDCITKPFRPGIRRARLRAQQRQGERSAYAVLTVGPYRFCSGPMLLLTGRGGYRLAL